MTIPPKIRSRARSGRGSSPEPVVVRAPLRRSREDQEDPEGLVRFNVIAVPQLRLLGINLLFLVAALHNFLVFGDLDLATFVPVVVGAELYCLATWGVLKTFFARVTSVHLGHVFLFTDLALFDLAVWVSGGHQSLLWPIFVLRTADQIWLHRGRAKLMAALGPLAYATLVAYQAVVEGQTVAWGGEVTKLAVLASMNLFLVLIAATPWQHEERTRQREEDRRQSEDAQSKTEFLGRMSHELRTPLNSVLGFTNVLLKKKELGSGAQDLDLLRRIRNNGMRLLELVNDLLDLDRIEEGKMRVEMKDLDLGSLIDQTVNQLDGWSETENVETRLVVPSALDPVRADEERLGQVLSNLVGNALKFTEEGSVTVRVEAEGRVVRRIHVEDTGIGVPPDRFETIFLPFEQVDGATTRAHDGSGVGLAISSALCGLMGMEVSVSSVPGEGSTFTVSLTPPPSQPPVPETQEAP